MSKRLFASFSFFAAAVIAAAAPLFDQPVPEVHLTNGEVLYDVQAKGFNSTSVMVKYRDGAKTVAYDLFPADLKALVLARKPQPRVATFTAANPTVEVAHTDKPKKVTMPDRLPGDRYKGLSLLSTSPGTGFTQAEIYNDTTETVAIEPGVLQAELDNGKLVNGRHWVDTDEQGNINSTLKASQELLPKSTTSLKVSFPTTPGVSVGRVAWSQN